MRDSRRIVPILLVILTAVIGLYWGLWYGDRTVVASESASFYQNFESAFPLADGLLGAAMLACAWAIRRGRASAVLFGLVAAGGGLYLFAMDVLFDLEHGIWGRGAAGAIELVINVVTLLASVLLGGWIWRSRHTLESADHARTHRQ